MDAAPATGREHARAGLVLALFATGWLGAYSLTTVLKVPLVWYAPVERAFYFEVRPAVLAMDFFGRLLACLLGGALLAGLGGLLARRARLETLRHWLVVACGWSAALLFLTASLYVFTLSQRVPVPVPLPEQRQGAGTR